MKTVLSVKNLSKQYTLGSESLTGQSFREMLLGLLLSPIRKFKRLRGTDSKQPRFWAIKDLSFDVQGGEIIGVIGRNGAGKSTLLKVLSRITPPTEGVIEYKGLMTSLLEVGTGFHPELTGRENIYLNGAILGLSRKAITQKLNDIVTFADIEKFLDTPVKRYSSGMYVRLAFSVASHLEADILVVDEVLAVGDSAFQKKCLEKIRDVANTGRTVFFVSHNISAVSRLCTRGIWLDKGRIKMDGEIQSVLNAYDEYISPTNDSLSNEIASNETIGIRSMSFWPVVADSKNRLQSGADCSVEIIGTIHTKLDVAVISVGIYDDFGKRLCLINSNNYEFSVNNGLGNFRVLCQISSLPLAAGRYSANLSVSNVKEHLIGIERAAVFYVVESNSTIATKAEFGPLLIDANWSEVSEEQ